MSQHRNLDELMESASAALVRMEYLTCEAQCLEALVIARAARDWAYYARILLPLQEARRQRRMIAAEGVLRLGSATLEGGPEQWIERMGSGCLVLTRPYGSDSAREANELARRQNRYIEVLLADNTVECATWTIRSFNGSIVQSEIPAPPVAWRDRWITAQDPAAADSAGRGPDDWFIDATESLGDAAIAHTGREVGGVRRIEALERCLQAMTDHEKIHQRLAEAAKELAAQTPQPVARGSI